MGRDHFRVAYIQYSGGCEILFLLFKIALKNGAPKHFFRKNVGSQGTGLRSILLDICLKVYFYYVMLEELQFTVANITLYRNIVLRNIVTIFI